MAMSGCCLRNISRHKPIWVVQGQVLTLFTLCFSYFTVGQVRYSVPEEMRKGSYVGNVVQDLGLDVKRLRSGRARIIAEHSAQYVELQPDKGLLVVAERIDREQLCRQISPCSLSFDIILESPVEMHNVVVEILDVNDNAPQFKRGDIKIQTSESAALGTRFVLDTAQDPDVGVYALQEYILSVNDHFVLKQHATQDGAKYAEMVLHKQLDREREPTLALKLIAVDGGDPPRSGTVNIDVTVLDANDNAPVFNQTVYRASVVENALKGTVITTVNASDADSGSNGVITYSFTDTENSNEGIFSIDENTGKISVTGLIDYEKDTKLEMSVKASDQGGLTDYSKVVIEIVDINDNAPVINVMSFSNPVSEDSPLGSTIAIINIKDADSDENGMVTCTVNPYLPFTLKSSRNNYYTLVTDAALDRETLTDYNITILTVDSGLPSLSSSVTLTLKVSDVNDNPPVFEQVTYVAHVMENNSPGVSIFTVRAKDSDWSYNARISYLLEETQISGTSVSSYVSVNAETGVVCAVRTFDYEQIKQIKFTVKAQDGGSPPLSSNVTVTIRVQDQNDNAPQVLYPVQTGTSVLAEMVPRSAELGYLVTKVVAVDVDSGQNAWLSYKLVKGTDRALFEVGLQNGEIRTIRPMSEKDGVKQKLTVVVEDNGQPSRSTTVNVNVVVADSFPEVLTEISDFTHEKDYNDSLTFYLILALAVVSFLFIVSLIAIISVKIHRWRQSRIFYQSNLPVIPYYPPLYADVDGTGTLRHVYNYDGCGTASSYTSECKFVRPCSKNVLLAENSAAATLQHTQGGRQPENEQDSPLEVSHNLLDNSGCFFVSCFCATFICVI